MNRVVIDTVDDFQKAFLLLAKAIVGGLTSWPHCSLSLTTTRVRLRLVKKLPVT